jgi:hypothetical protein
MNPLLAAALFLAPAPKPDPATLGSELARLPPPCVVDGAITFGEAHLAWLDRRIEGDAAAADTLWAWRAETNRRLGMYGSLRHARSCWHAGEWDACAGHLDDVRREAGAAAYFDGRLPCVAPLEYFGTAE